MHLTREETRERARQRPVGEVLELDGLPLGPGADDARQAQHSEPHVARLVLQDIAADLVEQRVLGRLAGHLEQRHGEGLGLEADLAGANVISPRIAEQYRGYSVRP